MVYTSNGTYAPPPPSIRRLGSCKVIRQRSSGESTSLGKMGIARLPPRDLDSPLRAAGCMGMPEAAQRAEYSVYSEKSTSIRASKKHERLPSPSPLTATVIDLRAARRAIPGTRNPRVCPSYRDRSLDEGGSEGRWATGSGEGEGVRGIGRRHAHFSTPAAGFSILNPIGARSSRPPDVSLTLPAR